MLFEKEIFAKLEYKNLISNFTSQKARTGDFKYINMSKIKYYLNIKKKSPFKIFALGPEIPWTGPNDGR